MKPRHFIVALPFKSIPKLGKFGQREVVFCNNLFDKVTLKVSFVWCICLMLASKSNPKPGKVGQREVEFYNNLFDKVTLEVPSVWCICLMLAFNSKVGQREVVFSNNLFDRVTLKVPFVWCICLMLAFKSKVGQREVVQRFCNSLPSDLQLISAPRVPNILNENAADISKYIILVDISNMSY